MLASSTKREEAEKKNEYYYVYTYTRSASYIISLFFIAQHAGIPFCLTSIIHPNDPRVYVYIYVCIGNRMKKEKN